MLDTIRPSEARQRTVKAPRLSARLAQLQLGRYSGIFIFIAIFAIFAVWMPQSFLTEATWRTILQGQAITAILAVTLLFPLAAGGFDLSVAQIMGFCALVCGSIISRDPGFGAVPVIILTLVLGALIGAVNGFLVSVLNLGSFIATLGTTSLLVGIAALVGNGQYFGPFPDSFRGLTAGNVLGIPVLTLYLLAIALVFWYFLEHTPWGRRVYATGANPDAARLAGIRTGRFVFWSFVISGTGASIAGILLASNLNSVNQSLGPQYLLPAFAAAFLGMTQLKPGRFNIWGTVLAIFLLGTGVQGLRLAGADLWVTDVFNGLALIVAVAITVFMQRRKGRREVKEKAAEVEATGAADLSPAEPTKT